MLFIVVVFCIVFFALFDIAVVNFRFIDIHPGLGSILNIFIVKYLQKVNKH